MNLFRRSNRTARTPRNKGRTYPPDFLRREEIEVMLDELVARGTVSAARDHALIVVLWRAGLRVSEALALMPYDVDLANRTIRVLHGKGDRPRTVGIDEGTAREIEAWLEVRRAWIPPADAPLFGSRFGTEMSSASVRQMLPVLAADAGVLRRVHPHIFRHTYAVELVREGVPLPHIQRLLGHRSLSVTATYLASIAPEEALGSVRNRTW